MTETSQDRKRTLGRPGRTASRIKALRDSGLSFREIARVTGFGYGTVRRAYTSAGAGRKLPPRLPPLGPLPYRSELDPDRLLDAVLEVTEGEEGAA